eukprot:3697611-Amphidinium_carterae.1
MPHWMIPRAFMPQVLEDPDAASAYVHVYGLLGINNRHSTKKSNSRRTRSAEWCLARQIPLLFGSSSESAGLNCVQVQAGNEQHGKSGGRESKGKGKRKGKDQGKTSKEKENRKGNHSPRGDRVEKGKD